MALSLIIGYKVKKKGIKCSLSSVLFLAANLLINQHHNFTISCVSFTCISLRFIHVAFHSLPALKHDVFRPRLRRAAAVPGTCYSLSSCSHQPPTEPHTPHGPRLPGTKMSPEQMYHDTHIKHKEPHKYKHPHTSQSISCMPIFKPAAAYSAR